MICQNSSCGKEFHPPPSLVRRGGGLYCSRPCKYAAHGFREKQSRLAAESMTPEHRRRLSLAHKAVREKHVNAITSGKVPGWFKSSEQARVLLDQLLGICPGWESEVALSFGPIRIAIADLLHREKRIIVEVDGQGHSQERIRRHDASRDAKLSGLGYRVLRVLNSDVSSGEALDRVRCHL